jgi:hypothetical protein
MKIRSFAFAAVALLLAFAAARPALATTVFCAHDEADLYSAFAAGYWVNDSVEVRLVAGEYWLDRDLRFDNYFGQRLYLKGGYGSSDGVNCNLRVWNATRSVIRAAYATGYDVELFSARRVEIENLSFYELDEILIDVHGGYADVKLNGVKIESTGGLKVDTTDANSSRVQIWNTAVLRSYEAPAVRLVLDDTELSMLYTTIYDNDRTSAEVGGLYLDTDGLNTHLSISRSVFWDNGPVDVYVDDDSLSGNDVILDTLEVGGGGWPTFMSYTRVDPRLDYDGAPLPDSPCLDAASTTTSIRHDLLGRSRVRGSRSDIGAYEGPID